MVLCGGLELVAVGYLLNEFNQDKTEQRRRRRRSSNRPSSSSRPPKGSSSTLKPPKQGPARPSSAPPMPVPNGPHGAWQTPSSSNSHPPPYPGPPAHWQQPPTAPGYPPQQAPRPLNHPTSFPAQQQQRPNPRLQHPNSFPVQARPPVTNAPPPQQPVKPAPPGPLLYIDTKTGKVQHNMYPPDHPMARDIGSTRDDSGFKGNVYSHPELAASQPAELDGTSISRSRAEGMAYGKDYTRRSHSSTGR